MKKITIIGDIVCDKEMLKRANTNKNEYDFNNMFLPLKDYFKKSDIVVSNLDTTISNNNYTKSTFSFCSPSSLLDALKNIGVTAISLANNHVLDRDYIGLKTTIEELNKRNIKYFGVNDLSLDLDYDDINLSILGYTDSTNYHINKIKLNNEFEYRINVLKNTNELVHRSTSNKIQKIYYKLHPEIRLKIKRILHKKVKPIIDNKVSLDNDYLNKLKSKIASLKSSGRHVIMYPHIGGQYNIYPGKSTSEYVKFFIENKCDNVVITHPHIIQNMNYDKRVYSIGGLIISPTSKFVVWDTFPEYSVVLNYYFKNKRLEKLGISFLICVKDKKSYLKVYPFYDFYNNLNEKEKIKYKKQFDIVFNRVFNHIEEIKEEYIVRV